MFGEPRTIDNGNSITTYRKIKVGNKNLDNATLNLGSLKEFEFNWKNKGLVMQALIENDIPTLRKIS